MNDMENISIFFSIVRDNNVINLLLYGDDKFDDIKNRKKSTEAQKVKQKVKLNILIALTHKTDVLTKYYIILVPIVMEK